jgi:hypothetical protein
MGLVKTEVIDSPPTITEKNPINYYIDRVLLSSFLCAVYDIYMQCFNSKQITLEINCFNF